MKVELRVISLGAGVQSTTLVLMAAHGEADDETKIALEQISSGYLISLKTVKR